MMVGRSPLALASSLRKVEIGSDTFGTWADFHSIHILLRCHLDMAMYGMDLA